MVSNRHPDYTAAAFGWRRCRDVDGGRDSILAATTKYLPWPDGMSEADYRAYLQRAMVLPVFGRTVAALAGAILRRPPRVSAPDWLRDQLADVTRRDESLSTIALGTARELLTVGRHGILIDAPVDGGLPYWVRYDAEQIINWREAPVRDDPSQLVQVVLHEQPIRDDGDDPFARIVDDRYRELAIVDGRYQQRLWTRTRSAYLQTATAEHWTSGDWITPTRRGTPLNFIPFVFINPTGVTVDVARPPLLDLADVNLAHYRNSADREHGLFYVSLPTPWVAGAIGDGMLKIGPGTAWRLGENGKAGMLEFSGAGIAAIERAMKEKENHMAALGAKLLETPTMNATATAVLERQAGSIASLRTIASSLGAALTTVTRWYGWWVAGAGPIDLNVRVDIADDLDRLRVTAEDVKAAMLAVQGDLLSFDSFYALLEQGGWTRPGATAADEREAIVAASRLLTDGTDDNE
jgi:hypothetical protein